MVQGMVKHQVAQEMYWKNVPKYDFALGQAWSSADIIN